VDQIRVHPSFWCKSDFLLFIMDEYQAPFWFIQQLAETQRWCQPRTVTQDLEHCLRSPEIRPALELFYSNDRAIWVQTEMIREVTAQRKAKLAQKNEGRSSSPHLANDGRLLLCAYDYTNHNGATAAETDFFLDENDVPPWDTWVGEVTGLGSARALGIWGGAWPPTLDSTIGQVAPNQGLLVCWIPNEFVRIVEQALEIECVGMLCWADAPVRGGSAGPDFGSVVPFWLRELALRYRPS
jgi:hypothetical protein